MSRSIGSMQCRSPQTRSQMQIRDWCAPNETRRCRLVRSGTKESAALALFKVMQSRRMSCWSDDLNRAARVPQCMGGFGSYPLKWEKMVRIGSVDSRKCEKALISSPYSEMEIAKLPPEMLEIGEVSEALKRWGLRSCAQGAFPSFVTGEEVRKKDPLSCVCKTFDASLLRP